MQICFSICKLVFNLKYNACHSTFNAIYMPCTCNDDKIPSTGSYVARSERLIKNKSKYKQHVAFLSLFDVNTGIH